MACPACGYAWDKSKNSCPQCGFRMNPTIQSAPMRESEEIRQNVAQMGNVTHSELAVGGSRKALPSLPKGPSGALSEASVTPERQSGPLLPKSSPGLSTRSLAPGTLLRNGRYRVQVLLKRQVWGFGAYEATWMGRDFQREKQVKICEVALPENQGAQTLPIMHTATKSLLAVRQSPNLTPLLDAFSDQGRSFFVFGLPTGENLTTQIHRLQSPFSEQAIVDFCLQMADVLEMFSQKSPSLVHGLICPEHVFQSYDGSQYVLGNFSILMAGRANQFLAGIDRSQLSPYVAPEFVQNGADMRTDLYSVLATAYYLATGSPPSANNSLRARSVNPAISSALDAILAKGLHPAAQQRYQHPSQLRQELLVLRSQPINEIPVMQTPRPVPTSGLSRGGFTQPSPQPGASAPGTPYPLPVPILAREEEEAVLLPAPETLSPLPMGQERLEAIVVLALLLLGLGILTELSHFHI